MYKIKRKAWWWKVVPLTGRDRFSCTMGDTIYLTPKRYDDWSGGSPKVSTVALVEHEKVHVDQWRRDKHFKRDYLGSRRKRLAYEAEAYAKQAFIRVKWGGKDRDERVARYAKTLASRTYLLFYDYAVVWDAIDREYQKLVDTGVVLDIGGF